MRALSSKRYIVVMLGVLLGICIIVAELAVAENLDSILVVGITADIRAISPTCSSTYQDWVVGHNVYASLIEADENFNPAPSLAKSWDVSPDKLTYTFHLCENATFHDGSPITSQDVEFSMREIALSHINTCKRGLETSIESFETPDDHTFVIHLRSPFPEMLNPQDGVGLTCTGVVKKDLYEGTDVLSNPYNREPIGSGPFKFVEWVRGSHILLERYEGYYGEIPAIKQLLFRIIPDPAALVLAFEKGELDWVPFYFPASEVERLNALPGKKVFFHGTPCSEMVELGFNFRRDPFQNKTVRKALTAAINTQKVVDLVYYGGATAGTGHIVPTAFSSWWANLDSKQISYDPELAAVLLDTAGYPIGSDGWRFHISLKHTTGVTEHIKVAQLIKDDWKKIGVDLEIISLDHAAWHEQVFKNWDFDTSLFPFCGGPNPSTMKRFHTEQIVPISWANCMGFSNTEYDALFNVMLSELDVEKRKKYLYRMQDILAEEQPVAFIASKLSATAVKEGFTEEPKNVWVLGLCWMQLNRIQPLE
jgi:peptide/nickel transport system substrate-binding protein